MSSRTTYSSRDGRLTGKTVTTSHSNGAKTVDTYKATGSGLSRALGPGWKATSTSKVDSRGNSSTKTFR